MSLFQEVKIRFHFEVTGWKPGRCETGVTWKTKVDIKMKESPLFRKLLHFVKTSYRKKSERVMLVSELMFKTSCLNSLEVISS